jgi:hypothetical protein
MNAVVETEVLTPLEQLDAIRERIATATANLDRLRCERERCLTEAERHRKVVEALPLARARLTELHERQTCGEAVSDKAISQAEENLRNAQTMADRAELAEKGARAAAQKFTDQQQPFGRDLAAATAAARQVLSVLLREKVEESRAQYRRDAEEFTRTQHARHHGAIAAIAALAQQLKLSDVLLYAIPNGPSGVVEFIGTGTQFDPGAIFVVDARPAIKTETQACAEELALLIEGVL